MLALLVVVVLLAAAVKLVVALCGHTITWRLSLVAVAALVVLGSCLSH